MKRSLFVCLAMLLNVSVSNALNLNDVVLGEDAMETPTIYRATHWTAMDRTA